MDIRVLVRFIWGMGKERVFNSWNDSKQMSKNCLMVVFGGNEHGIYVGN